MRRKRRILRFSLMAGLLAVLAVAAQPLPASFTTGAVQMHVVIGGVDFGAFDRIPNLESLRQGQAERSLDQQNFHRITLKRDFVTDKSLYLWAASAKETPSGVLDVRLVMKNASGEELSRYILKLCQPIAWSVEAANPALGGFHEAVDFAVQNIVVE